MRNRVAPMLQRPIVEDDRIPGLASCRVGFGCLPTIPHGARRPGAALKQSPPVDAQRHRVLPMPTSRCTKIGTLHVNGRHAPRPRLSIRFYRTASSNEPVREWLMARSRDDRRRIGEDLKTAQYGWPLGMPLVRKLEPGLWEVRTALGAGSVRILFTVRAETMLLLHAFTKTSRRTPRHDLAVARRRLAKTREGGAP